MPRNNLLLALTLWTATDNTLEGNSRTHKGFCSLQRPMTTKSPHPQTILLLKGLYNFVQKPEGERKTGQAVLALVLCEITASCLARHTFHVLKIGGGLQLLRYKKHPPIPRQRVCATTHCPEAMEARQAPRSTEAYLLRVHRLVLHHRHAHGLLYLHGLLDSQPSLCLLFADLGRFEHARPNAAEYSCSFHCTPEGQE